MEEYPSGANLVRRSDSAAILKDLFALLSDDEKSVRLSEGFSLLDFKRVAQSRTTSTDCLAWRTTRAAFGPSR